MNIQKELAFLQEVTLGLFNKKGTSFEIKTNTREGKGKLVQILIVNDKTSGSGTYQRIHLSYFTSSDTVNIRFFNNTHSIGSKEVSKSEAHSYFQELLDSPEGKGKKEFSTDDATVDFYGIIDALSEQVFVDDELFELNVWKRDLHLYKNLDAKYGSLIDSYHVHGGVGSVSRMEYLADITNEVEFGTLPGNGKTYLGVINDRADSPKYPAGIYEDATVEMFVESVVEQYKKAWNRKKQNS